MITSAQFNKTTIGKDQEHLFRGLAECSGVPESLSFGDGLTLVVGPNGSGKSLLLAALAAGCAAIYGRPEISKRALSDFFLFGNTSKIEGITVCHDGQVLYVEPTLNFFERNTSAYLASAIRRSEKSMSRGEFVLQSLRGVMQLLAQAAKKEMFFDLEAEVSKAVAKRKNKPNEKELNKIKQNVLEKFEKKGMFPAIAFPRAVDALAGQEVAEAWREKYAYFKAHYFDPKIASGKPTLILDEPDSHLSLPMQAKMWSLLLDPAVLEHFQIIVATHSLYAFQAIKNKRTNVIETERGFVESVLQVLP